MKITLFNQNNAPCDNEDYGKIARIGLWILKIINFFLF